MCIRSMLVKNLGKTRVIDIVFLLFDLVAAFHLFRALTYVLTIGKNGSFEWERSLPFLSSYQQRAKEIEAILVLFICTYVNSVTYRGPTR